MTRFRALLAVSVVFVWLPGVALAVAPIRREAGEVVYLSEMVPVFAAQGWGSLGMDRSVQDRPLRIGTREFARGLGTHARSEIAFDLEDPCERFEAWVGVDVEMAGYPQASVVFQVLADGREVFDSGVMRPDTPAKPVSISLTGVRQLRLVVTDGGDGIDADHADWADARLVGVRRQQTPVLPARYTVRARGIALRLTGGGEIAGVEMRAAYAARGGVRLAGCRDVGPVAVRRLPSGGMEFARKLAGDSAEKRGTLVERFRPAKDSIRWEVEVRGESAPWTAPIVVRLRWPEVNRARFWTSWGDPEPSADGWRDPLTARPFAGRRLVYGTGFSLPLVTVLDEARGAGLSLVQSPEDSLLALSLSTGRGGDIVLTHADHRIAKGRTVRLIMDLTSHEADWRGGLRWMAARYPRFFNPPNPKVHAMAGCAAYSGFEGELDAAKLKRMAFRVNWKASFDFPFMGMFLPPVPGEEDTWPRFDSDSGGSPIPGRQTRTSRRQMNDYSRRMRAVGFHVLNYFNVTEFGAYLKGPEQAKRGMSDAEAWQDATTFLYTRIADGVLPTPDGGRYGTWGGAVAMDPGGPHYRRFLLEQARRHIEKLPDSSGLCIDRTDWLALYNPRADDGASWWNGRPARSLLNSWKGLMSDLGPMLHRAGKVLFINTLCARLEITREVDGFYAEFGNRPAWFNMTALMGLRKPALQWTASEADLRPDPDAFFQRHLYMGCYPTAPFPGNDHTIAPSPWAEPFYQDYGPMLDALCGRTWALWPRPVKVTGGTAKANLFTTPEGWVVPVVFGGSAARAAVTVRGLTRPGACEAITPGSARWKTTRAVARGSEVILDVPLKRGCAMIRIRRR